MGLSKLSIFSGVIFMISCIGIVLRRFFISKGVQVFRVYKNILGKLSS